MAKLQPLSHRNLVARLRQLGFQGPYAGGKHPMMVRGDVRATIPNIHGEDIGVALLSRILKRAGVSRDEWESLD